MFQKSTTIPRLLWCPGLQASAWVDPGSGQRYASFQQWLFERASEQAWLQRRPVVLLCSKRALLGEPA